MSDFLKSSSGADAAIASHPLRRRMPEPPASGAAPHAAGLYDVGLLDPATLRVDHAKFIGRDAEDAIARARRVFGFARCAEPDSFAVTHCDPVIADGQ